jgi:hypothetical protein
METSSQRVDPLTQFIDSMIQIFKTRGRQLSAVCHFAVKQKLKNPCKKNFSQGFGKFKRNMH